MILKKLQTWHDLMLLKDLEKEKLSFIIGYIVIGVIAVTVGLLVSAEINLEGFLLLGGPFLIGVGIEKLVSRRIRHLLKIT